MTGIAMRQIKGGYTVSDTASAHTVTIRDDEAAPVLSFDGAATRTVDEGGGSP